MNEVKIFLAHWLKGLPVNLTQKNNMKFKLIYSTAQRYLVQVAGNCEEELPKKPVGRLSADCRPTVDRQSADSLPTG